MVATAVGVIKTGQMPKLDLPPRIVSLVARCDRQDLADKLIGLSLLPEFQANYPRILTLLHLALARARGARRTSVSELASLLNGLDGHDIGRSEDPAEDVFVSNVATFGGNYRIFNGVFTASAFSLERLLDAVFGGDFPARELLWAQCHALLILSDAIAERRGLNANDYAESVPRQSRWPLRLPPLVEAARSVRFAPDDLAGLGVDIDVLVPFILGDLTERRPCRQLQAPDIAAASGGMRDRLAGQVDSVVTPEMEAVDGEELVGDVLRAAVDARWRRCRDRLEQLDRAATLRLIARMIEAVHRDRVRIDPPHRVEIVLVDVILGPEDGLTLAGPELQARLG